MLAPKLQEVEQVPAGNGKTIIFYVLASGPLWKKLKHQYISICWQVHCAFYFFWKSSTCETQRQAEEIAFPSHYGDGAGLIHKWSLSKLIRTLHFSKPKGIINSLYGGNNGQCGKRCCCKKLVGPSSDHLNPGEILLVMHYLASSLWRPQFETQLRTQLCCGCPGIDQTIF